MIYIYLYGHSYTRCATPKSFQLAQDTHYLLPPLCTDLVPDALRSHVSYIIYVHTYRQKHIHHEYQTKCCDIHVSTY